MYKLELMQVLKLKITQKQPRIQIKDKKFI